MTTHQVETLIGRGFPYLLFNRGLTSETHGTRIILLIRIGFPSVKVTYSTNHVEIEQCNEPKGLTIHY